MLTNVAINRGLFLHVIDGKDLLLRYFIVVSVDNYINIVPNADKVAIVWLEGLLAFGEAKIVVHILCEVAWWFYILPHLEKHRVSLDVLQILDHAYALDPQAGVLNSFVFH